MSEASEERGPLLALDYGRRRIGVAACDALGMTAQSLGFIPRESDEAALRVVLALLRQHQAKGLVIGLPLHVSGDVSDNVKHVRRFMSLLRRETDVPLHEVDERYSSSEAEELLRAKGEWPVEPGRLDGEAAAVILRRYLDGER